jgi:hypothetical protein
VRVDFFDDLDVLEAIATIDAWIADNCGFAVNDVTAREYAYDGIPQSTETGVHLFRLRNDGAELHELAIVRIKGDQSIEEIVELSEKKAQKKVQLIGACQSAQGEISVHYADLQRPGRYAAVCFLPVGSTTEEALEEASQDPNVHSHATEGMVAEFEVERG